MMTSATLMLAKGFHGEYRAPIVQLGDVVNLHYGKALPADSRNPGEIKVYGSNGQCGWHDVPLRNGPTVILGRKGQGPLGVKWCAGPFWVIDTAYFVTVDPERLDLRYFYYLAGYIGLNHLKHGTSNPSLQREVFCYQSVPLPDLPTQRRIAGILSAYDDLIENNLRRIKILEEMAQSLYREWFVHFRFPGHESVLLVESPLGRIPEGWKVGRLEDVLVLQRGFDLPKAQRVEGDVPIYAATGVTGFHEEAKVKAPGVVTGRSGTIGNVSYVQEDFWPLNTALWVKEFPKSEPLFAFYVLGSLDLKQFNSGAAVPTLNRNDIHGLVTLIPSRALQGMFGTVAGSIHRQMRVLQLKNENLRQTRDSLLPKLLNSN